MSIEAEVAVHHRDAGADIRALACSGYATLCASRALAERVQRSPAAERPSVFAGARASRAQAILGRMYALGADERRFAIALWWTFAPERSLDGPEQHLAIALALLVEPAQRLEVVSSWQHWGKGPSARVLRERGALLLARAVAAYAACDDRPGASSNLALLMADADRASAVSARLRADNEAGRDRDRALCPRRFAPRAVVACAVRRDRCDNPSGASVVRCERSRQPPCVSIARVDRAPCADAPRAVRRLGLRSKSGE